jgi:hypothetical protein
MSRMIELRPTARARTVAIIASLALASAIIAHSERAHASEGEVVTHLALFEINSDGVHDELARQLSDALRKEVLATPGHQLSDARVSLEQLSLVHDCDTAELACLGKIARQLGVGGFIYGQMQAEGNGAYAEVRLFDAGTQSVKHVSRMMFAQRDASEVDVSRKARIIVAQLLESGQAPASEQAAPQSVPEVTAPTPEQTALDAQASSGISAQSVAGYALLGGAALSVGLSVLAFVEIDRAKSNGQYDDYRRAVGRTAPTVKDVCDEAANDRRHGLDAKSFSEVKSECSTGRTFEVLQFVFLGAAAVTGGLSAFLLLSDDTGSERKSSALMDALPIHPVVRRNSAELRARIRF